MEYLLFLPLVRGGARHFARAGPIAWLAQFHGLEFPLPAQAVVLASI
jgi:hypothetical protein